MKDTNELNLEIERIKGDIKLIEQSLDTIKNNHLFHIENSIKKINNVLWTVGIMIFAQLIIVLRDLIF
ncbi:MAG: hypothetical protein CMF96_04035 [Candidatus Marinimicrobia bacterium]|jgi:hypothetical protein|nr:hypothetical protein [Candidatus Neomarinimicrobiota bacterium]